MVGFLIPYYFKGSEFIMITLLAGLIMTRFFKKLKLPSVTAYLIAGVLIGPYFCLWDLVL